MHPADQAIVLSRVDVDVGRMTRIAEAMAPAGRDEP